MARIALIARSSHAWANSLLNALRRTRTTHACDLAEIAELCARADGSGAATSFVYIPSFTDRAGMMPDLSEAQAVFAQAARLRPRKLVLLSSALIYGAGTARKNLVTEDYV